MLRLAIAGSGGMAEYQAKKFGAIPACVLSACKDHRTENAAAFARRFGIPRHFDSMDGLLAADVADALTCVVIDSRHRAICEPALVRGLPVFCEKPLARTVADCHGLAERAAASGAPCLVNFTKRNAPALWALRRALREGMLGTIETVAVEYLQSWVATKAWGDWLTASRWRWRLSPGKSSAGVAGDLGSHAVDALLFLFSALEPAGPGEVVTLEAAMAGGRVAREPLPPEFGLGTAAGTVPVEFSCAGTVGGGIPFRLKTSWIERDAGDDFRIAVRGSKALALLDLGVSRDSVRIRKGAPGEGGDIQLAGSPGYTTYGLFVELAALFTESGGTSVAPAAALTVDPGDIPDFSHGLRVHRLLDALVPGGMPT